MVNGCSEDVLLACLVQLLEQATDCAAFCAWLTDGSQQSYKRGAKGVSFGVCLPKRHAEAGRASLC